MTIDLTKTLDELEGTPFGEPTFQSGLVLKVCWLYKNKRLCDYDAGDFRVIIGQKFSLNFLIPPALQLLKENPWVEGTYYEGDLLCNVLEAPHSYWEQHPDDLSDALAVIGKACTWPIPETYGRECRSLVPFLQRHDPDSPYMDAAREL